GRRLARRQPVRRLQEIWEVRPRRYSGVSVRALALATAGIFAAAGCGGSNGPVGQNPAPPDKQVLRVNVDTEPATLDPTQQSWAYEGAVGRNVFEALTRPKADLSDVEG